MGAQALGLAGDCLTNWISNQAKILQHRKEPATITEGHRVPEMRFDTEKMVEQLEDAGVPQAQARAHVALLTNSINTTEAFIIERCASKHEVSDQVALIKAEFEKQRLHFDDAFEALRQHVDAEIEKLRLDFDAKLENQRLDFQARLSDLRSDLIKWVVSVGILQIALIVALVLKLVP